MFTPDEAQKDWSSELIAKFLACVPGKGEPGIQYQENVRGGKKIQYLIKYDANGLIQGALRYFPVGYPLAKQPGEIEMAVKSEFQKQGIGSELLNEAISRWDIQAKKQRYTEASAQLYQKWKSEAMKEAQSE